MEENLSVFRKKRVLWNKKEAPAPRKNALIQFWNSQSPMNMRKHTPGTKTYVRITQQLKDLQTKGFSPSVFWDDNWRSKYKIQDRFLREPWTASSIQAAMIVLNDMAQEGYWPGPEKWFTSMALDALIYNPRSQTSWLAYARNIGKAQPMREQRKEILVSSLSDAERAFYTSIKGTGVVFPLRSVSFIVKQYNILYEKTGLMRHLCPNEASLGRVLSDYLRETGLSVTESSISENGWIWKKFLKEMFNVQGEGV